MTDVLLQGLKQYGLTLLVWISQTLNALVLLGHPDQTVSARAYVNRFDPVWGKVYFIINKVFYWQYDHCLLSHLEDVERAKYIQSQTQ